MTNMATSSVFMVWSKTKISPFIKVPFSIPISFYLTFTHKPLLPQEKHEIINDQMEITTF